MNKLEDREALMVRRALCTEESDQEPMMRKRLFKTIYKVVGNCCKVIIDSGSLDNLASEELVTKFQLPIMKHLKPYQIAWLKDDYKVLAYLHHPRGWGDRGALI